MKICKLPRSIITISSLDGNQRVVENFLQGLITNDIRLLEKQNIIYTCMLNPKGRYNFDFFIFKYADLLCIDIHNDSVQLFLDKINFYKLFHKIAINLENKLQVYYCNTLEQDVNKLSFHDPRLEHLGYRYITEDNIENTIKYQDYLDICYQNAVLDTPDYIFEKTIPIEVGMDELNAISYSKGCYLGQEFTNSAKRRLVIRKRIISVSLEGLTLKLNKKDIIVTEKAEKVGEIISYSEKYATAMIMMSFKDQNLYVKDHLIKQQIPSWIKEYSTV